MNQILYVDKPKKGGTLEINTIVRIFAIILVVLGVILIAKGAYGMYSSSKSIKETEPVVSIKEENGSLQINIIHDKAIDKIIYSWNNGEEQTLQGKGQSNITETIELPIGTNTLTIKIIDINKKQTIFTKEYYKSDEDTTSPEIEFTVEGSKVKIVAKDETQLSYIMYRWNDEDNTVLEAREDSKKQIEEKISILKGENKLTIIAVDVAGNETTKEQVFKGAKKPTIETSQENDELIIKISDEENIQKIELTVNGELFSTDHENKGTSLDIKEVELKQKLVSGQNTITITVYSVNGLSEQVTKEITL